jgi:hypothetical protein
MQTQFATHTELVEAVRRIQDAPRGWNSSEARELLAYAETALADLAKKYGMDPVDAVHEAWRLWQGAGIFSAEKAWPWTCTVVKNALKRQRYAQVAMTSEQGLERQSIGDFVGYADNALDAAEHLVREESTTPVLEFATPAFKAAEAILTQAGWDPTTTRTAIDAIAALGAACESMRGAYDQATRERGIPAALGIDRQVWSTICALLLGNSAGDLGLVEAGLRGVDPASVKNIRNASRRLVALAA